MVKKCPTCQKTKKKTSKCGHIPEKEPECKPWEILCVDLIGPYTIPTQNGEEPLKLWALTMIDPATNWFEMVPINAKDSMEIAIKVENTWLSRYPWPTQLICDRGTEFMNDFAKMLEVDYSINRNKTTVRNPRANSILERIHQTLGNIVRTFRLHDQSDLTASDSLEGILAAAMFALRSTYHTTLQATPAQLVFGRDAIHNIQFQADWSAIKARKKQRITANNKRENRSRINYQYTVGDQILIKVELKGKFAGDPCEGPYRVTSVNPANGTIRYQKGAVEDVINIRNVTPYHT